MEIYETNFLSYIYCVNIDYTFVFWKHFKFLSWKITKKHLP